MNNNTDVYEIMKKEFSEDFEYFGIENNKEVEAFIKCNLHNYFFDGTDEDYYHNVNFKDLATGNISRMFSEHGIRFFSKYSSTIKNQPSTSFTIGKKVKNIVVNSNGLFIENFDLKGNIITSFYDYYALDEIVKAGIDIGNMDYIEDKFGELGLKPDKIISVNAEKGKAILTVQDHIGKNCSQANFDGSRPLYSIYYQYMLYAKEYSLDDRQQQAGSSSR